MKTSTPSTTVTFETVLTLGASLPGVKVTRSPRGIALKMGGQMLACTAIHPSAEPNSLMVCLDFPARDALIERQPDTYYLTAHYRPYATVLVRLTSISASELQDLLEQATQFVAEQSVRKTAKPAARKTSKRAASRPARR